MRKVSIPKVSLNYIFLSPFREHEKQTLPKFKGKFADNSTANGWWYKANSPDGPKISLAAHVDEETKNFELYELSETPFFNNNNDLENIAATGNYGNVADMRNMFNYCSKLTSLDLSNFDTSSVTNMASMFNNCKITSLNLSGWDTSKVTDMSFMFSYCIGLTSLNLSGWNLSKVTGVGAMFNSCSKLTTITGPITGISASINLQHSPLTHDSAMVLMNGLNTVTETKTITFKSTTYETLTEVEIAAATAKGWTVASV